MFYALLVDGYKPYARRFFISDFLLLADNVNQPVLHRFSRRAFLRHLLSARRENRFWLVRVGRKTELEEDDFAGKARLRKRNSNDGGQDTAARCPLLIGSASRPSTPFFLVS